jgi:hypothetical protein
MWSHSHPRGSNFDARSFDALIAITHDEQIVDDELTTLIINHPWRRMISSALENYFAELDAFLATDVEYGINNDFNNLIYDLYTTEIIDVFGAIARLIKTAAQTFNSAVWTTVIWDTTYVGVEGVGVTKQMSASSTAITVTQAGLYHIKFTGLLTATNQRVDYRLRRSTETNELMTAILTATPAHSLYLYADARLSAGESVWIEVMPNTANATAALGVNRAWTFSVSGVLE